MSIRCEGGSHICSTKVHVKALSGEETDVSISFDQLAPLFDLVIAHTPRLAKAFNVDLPDLGNATAESSDVEDGVISLRRHLEAQKMILKEVA